MKIDENTPLKIQIKIFRLKFSDEVIDQNSPIKIHRGETTDEDR